ncbi:MAG: S-layer protein [Candidatus Diapherotrites archaeon]
MKGLTIKKLAAIAAGAVLVGTALAPIVTAIDLQRSDIYKSNGSPAVDIVVGKMAQVSDAVWAGNIAAKIASKAATSTDVAISGGGEGGTANPSDLSVDLAIGGVVAYGAGSKQYKVNLNSASGANEIDANILTSSQLTNLYNSDVTIKVNASTSTIREQEKITVTIDTKFDKTTDVKDLVGMIGSSQFQYKVDLGTGVPLNGSGNKNYSYYTDGGSSDNVKLPFFGTTYELKTADFNSTTQNVKLVRSSAKETYNEGQTITGLKGRGTADGKDLSVKVVQITQSGPASGSFNVTLELYDGETRLDTQTISASTDLSETFVDAAGDLVLASNLFVDTIALATTTSTGYIEITKGTDTVVLYSGKGYPYDSSNISGPYDYTVSFTTSGLNGSSAKFTGIVIQNSRERWDSGTSVLYPTNVNQSLTGTEGTQAVFGNALADGVAGKGYAKVEFQGFEGTQSKTSIKLGKITGTNPALDQASYGGAEFYDASGGVHRIPFALGLSDGGGQTGSGSFTFDGATIAYRVNYGSGTSARSGTRDVNITVTTGDYVNGRTWTITDTNEAQALVSVSGGIGVLTDTLGLGNWQIGTDANTAVDGVTYKLLDANWAETGSDPANAIVVAVDANVELQLNTLSASPKSNGTYIYNTSGDTTDDSYGQLYLSNDTTFEPAATVAKTAAGIGLYGSDNTRKAYYAARISTSGSTSRALWFVMDDQNFYLADSNVTQYSKAVGFHGTAQNDGTGGTAGNSVSYYSPDNIDFASNRAQTNQYYAAEFQVDDPLDTTGGGADFNVIIDTRDGGLIGPFPNDQLSVFGYDVNYNATNGYMLRSGTQSDYLSGGYTDVGGKATIDATNNIVSFSLPQNREQIVIYVLGAESTRTTTGDELTGLAEGDTGTTAAGTNITITKINYTAGDCGAAAAGSCTATPSKALTLASVPDNLVVLDTDNTSGSHIIVGGPIVNRLADQVSGLSERLNSDGDVVAEKMDGDIVVAGYSAADTGNAAQELIDAIDGLNP